MKLTVIGCGDAFGSGGRFNSCYHFETATTNFLLDCGISSLIGMRQFGIDPLKIDTIFISHLHGDHFGGLPFLLLDYKYVSQRTAPLVLIGPRELKARVEALCNALYQGVKLDDLPFEIRYASLNKYQILTSNGVTVQSFPARHSEEANPYCLRLGFQNHTIGYSGDTAWTDTLIPTAQNADLFITECSQWDQKTDVHLDYMTLKENIGALAPKKTLLTHMNPVMLDRVDQIDTDLFTAAHDGMVIDF